MHLRRFPAIEVPARLVQAVRVVEAAQRAAERASVEAVPPGFSATLAPSARHLLARAQQPGNGGALLLWEAHTEASSVTIFAQGPCDHPFDDASFEPACWAWLDRLPGMVVRCIRVALVATETEALPLVAEAGFDPEELVSCHLVGGCRIWSDFRLHGDHGRLVIAAGGLMPSDLGRVVQRVQELGNYRNLALLGLPAAQAALARLGPLEATLAEYARDISSGGVADAAMLTALSILTAELAAISAETGSRMNATQAYFGIVNDRLASLEVRSIAGYMSLDEFNDRRLVPAVRTCTSFVRRLEHLSERAAWITSLLRATIETHIESQNQALLRSVELNSARQLHLQHFVEKLSLVALSYYAIGILAYGTKGLSKLFHGVEPDLVVAAALPAVVLGIYLFLHFRMRSIEATEPAGAEGKPGIGQADAG